MATIENFQNQLESLSHDEWKKLFSLISEIEGSDKFGELAGGKEVMERVTEMPYWDQAQITQKFVKTMSDLGLVLNFDWMDWSEGREMLQNKGQEYEALDTVTLCKLLTTIIRGDRFNDGLLILNFENGNVLKIIRALKSNQTLRANVEKSDAEPSELSVQQVEFIWLAYGEGKSYAEICQLLNIERATITGWENDKGAKEFIKLKKYVSSIRKTYVAKKFPQEFNAFKEWFLKIEKDKKCAYCGINEEEITRLWKIEAAKGHELTTRPRGRKLELDRKIPKSDYNDFENIVYACYWCNNAKTDTFTYEEFLEVGKAISVIWKKRLSQ